MPPLTAQRLRDACALELADLQPRIAFRACRTLGSLARWWLRPEVLETARRHDPSYPGLLDTTPPKLPAMPGASWIVFCTREQLPLLRSAFLLPLRWLPGRGHSPYLPPELRGLADRVLDEIPLPAGQTRDWGLHPDERLGLDRMPLGEGLEFAFDSGWAGLAAGFIARSERLDPMPDVWASGAWNRHGLADIDGVTEKLKLAVEWGATDFFVPVWRVDEAEEWVRQHAPGRLRIGALAAPLDPKPRLALDQYLGRFTNTPEAPDPEGPDESEQFERCCNYFLHQPAFSESERAFYWSHLLPGIIRRLGARVRGGWPQLRATHFVTIVSRSHELAVLAPLAVGATSCLLLHTPHEQMKDLAEKCRDYLRDEKVAAKSQPFEPGGAMEAQIRGLVEEFTRDVPADQVVVDLKPGTKRMTYCQSRVARPGNWIFNLEARFLDDRRNAPGTERVELWQVEG